MTTVPAVHFFDTTGEAYDACQTDDLNDGDVIVVRSEGVVGVVDTWPVAVTKANGKLHALTDGTNVATWANNRADKPALFDGAIAAINEAIRLGFAVRPEENCNQETDTMTTQPMLDLTNAGIFHKVVDQVAGIANANIPETPEHLVTVRDNVRKAEEAARLFGMTSLAGDLMKVQTAFTARIANDNKGQKAAFTKAVRQFANESKVLHNEIEKRLAKDTATVEKFRGTAGGDQGATQAVVITNADGSTATATKKVKAPKAPKAPRVAKVKTMNPCHCGCGAMVAGLFAMGHDAKLKSRLLTIGRMEDGAEKTVAMGGLPEVAVGMLGDFCERWGIPYVLNDHVNTRLMTIEAKPLKPRAPKAAKVPGEVTVEDQADDAARA